MLREVTNAVVDRLKTDFDLHYQMGDANIVISSEGRNFSVLFFLYEPITTENCFDFLRISKMFNVEFRIERDLYQGRPCILTTFFSHR